MFTVNGVSILEYQHSGIFTTTLTGGDGWNISTIILWWTKIYLKVANINKLECGTNSLLTYVPLSKNFVASNIDSTIDTDNRYLIKSDVLNSNLTFKWLYANNWILLEKLWTWWAISGYVIKYDGTNVVWWEDNVTTSTKLIKHNILPVKEENVLNKLMCLEVKQYGLKLGENNNVYNKKLN